MYLAFSEGETVLVAIDHSVHLHSSPARVPRPAKGS